MADRKKTEIVVGFSPHLPSFVDKKGEQMEKADIILYEAPPAYIDFLLKGKITPTELSGHTKFPEVTEREYQILKTLDKQGKKIIGTDVSIDPVWKLLNPDKAARLARAAEIMERDPLKKKLVKYAKAEAEFNKIREEGRLNWIRQNLHDFEGKRIYIDAGPGHTQLYHMLKKELEPKGLSVKAMFFEKGMHRESRALQRFSPAAQLTRLYQFNLPVSRKRLRGIRREYRKSEKMGQKIMDRYVSQGMSEISAYEKAYYEVLNAPKKTSIFQRLRRKR